MFCEIYSRHGRGEGKREGREGLQADSLVFWQVCGPWLRRQCSLKLGARTQ